MAITKVQLQNFKGFDSIEFSCGKFTVFQGRSLQGKTTLLQAIKWAFIGGDDDFYIKNGTNTCEVILHTDTGVRIERRLTRGGKSKLFVYIKEQPVDKPQAMLNKNYNPFLFGPMEMLHMKPKDLNEFIAEQLSKRLKFSPEQIENFGLQEISAKDLEEDPINAIQKLYDKYYDARTEINRTVKRFEAKASAANVKAPTPDELKEQEELVKSLNKKLEEDKAHNIKLEVGKRNADARSRVKAELTQILADLKELEKVDVNKKEELSSKLNDIKIKADNALEAYKSHKANYELAENTLKKIESGQIKCPINAGITCTTNMSDYINDLTEQAKEQKALAEQKYNEAKNAQTELDARKKLLENISKKAELVLKKERAESIINELELIEGDPIDIAELEKDYNEASQKLNKMKVALELANVSGYDDLVKRQSELDTKVKTLDNVLKNKITEMLKLNIKNVTLTKEGIYFRGIPLHHEGDSAKLRLCTAILKDLFPRANVFNLDRLECIDPETLSAYIENSINDGTKIQYFATYVGKINFTVSPGVRVINVEKFKVI